MGHGEVYEERGEKEGGGEKGDGGEGEGEGEKGQ